MYKYPGRFLLIDRFVMFTKMSDVGQEMGTKWGVEGGQGDGY